MRRGLKKWLVALLALTCVITSVLGFAACDKKDDPVKFEGAGAYYYEYAGQLDDVVIDENGDVTLTRNGTAYKGKLTFIENDVTITFDNVDGKQLVWTGKLENGQLTVKDAANVVTVLLKKVNYTVTFDSVGGSAVAAVNVWNGQKVAKPADPTKDGFVFVGWYQDAEYNTPWTFEAQTVTANTTLYAYWVSASEQAYVVSFDLGYQEAPAMEDQTTYGKLKNVPTPVREGYTFAGWWISMYDNVHKLSYQWTEDTEIKQNTTLFAQWVQNGTTAGPAVSVSDTQITWAAISGVTSYTVTVTDAAGAAVYNVTDGATTRTFDFTQQAAGDYTVTVTAAGMEPVVRYYKNKVLPAVSVFEVVNFSELVFQPVEGAERYYLTVDCGNDLHSHTDVNLGNATTYNFANCPMQEGGIIFTVKASAEGRADSVSKAFVYNRVLEQIKAFTMNEETETLSWNAVAGATNYVVTVKLNGETVVDGLDVGGKTNYSLKNLGAGEIVVSVYPKTNGYNSPAAKEYTYNKQSIAAPAGLKIVGETLTWTDMGEGYSYVVKVNGAESTVTTNSLVLSNLNVGANTVQVCAKKDGMTSLWSDVLTVDFGSKPQNVRYENGAISWNAGFGVDYYEVTVNGGKEIRVEATSYTPTFSRSGAQTLAVRAISSVGTTEWAEVSVTVYKITFDSCGGTAVDAMFKAYGDMINELPVPEHEYNAFAGWYNSPNGATTNGLQYTAGRFEGTSDVVYYANWKGQSFAATFETAEDAALNGTTAEVNYGEAFKFPVPTSADGTMAFVGWFSAANGQGSRLTDEYGDSISVWNGKNATVYASFVEAFKFVATVDDQQNEVYSVQMGEQIDYVNKITIPEMYNGKPVAYITMGAFASCYNLVEVNIPDTIRLVGAAAGGASTSGPFAYCPDLKAVNVYETGNAVDPAYSSVDGVLLYNNPQAGRVELSYFPYSRTGEYVIPDGVQYIPLRAFSSADISKLTVPASVTEIGETAFYYCNYLTEVVFLSSETDNGGLTIGALAFQNCDVLKKVTLPKYLSSAMVEGGAALLDNIFAGCSVLDTFEVGEEGGTFTARDGVLYSADGKTLVYYPKAKTGAFVVPEEVETIAAGAFAGHKYLNKVTIPDTVASIEVGAFKGCTVLASVEFTGSGYTCRATIGEEAFADCKQLTNVLFAANSDVAVIGKNAFANTGLSLIGLATNDQVSTLPKTVEEIAEGAFNGTTLIKVAFEEGGSALTLADNAFANNIRLMSVSFPAALTNLNLNAFTGCAALREISVNENNASYSSKNGVLYNKAGNVLLYYTKDAAADETFASIFDGVTEIGANAFEGNATLTTITIPKTVRAIGEGAFMNCTSLATVIFEAGRTDDLTFGDSAFKNCIALTEIALPEKTTNVSASMFENAEKLATVTMQTGVTEISANAFANTILKELEMADTVTSLGANLFGNCTALTSVTLSDGLKDIPADLFAGCSSLATINMPAAVERIGANAFKGTKISAVAIPNTVTEIGEGAFAGIASLTTLTFAEGGAEALFIDTNAFSGTGITAVTLPSRLISAEANVFKGSSLTNLAFEKDTVTDANFTIKENAYSGLGLTSVVIPAGTLKVCVNAFANNASLETVVFANGTTELTVEACAFLNCSAMTSMTLPYNLAEIGGNLTEPFDKNHLYGFDGTWGNNYTDKVEIHVPSNKLTSITIAKGADDAENQTYYVENGVVYSGTEVVWSVGGVTEAVSLKEGTTAIAFGAFSGVQFASITLPNTLKTIGDYAFTGAAFNTIEIPASVTEIGDYAFFKAQLKTITFAEGTEKLVFGEYTFAKSALSAFEVPARVKTLARGMFAQANLPESGEEATGFSFTLAEGCTVTEIPAYAFYRSGVTELVIPTGITTVGGGAYADCEYLTTVFIPNTVEVIAAASVDPDDEPCIDNEGFWGIGVLGAFTNSSLNTLTFEKGSEKDLQFIPDDNDEEVGMFENCFNLTAVEIPARLVAVPKYTFYMDSWDGTSKLTTLTFEEGSKLTLIDDRAFAGTAITSVVIPDTVTQLGTESLNSDSYSPQGPFSECLSLTSITLPKGLVAFDRAIFYKATSLTELKFSGESTVYALEDGVIYNKDKTDLLYYFSGKTETEFTVPEGVINIAPYAFFHGDKDFPTALTTVNLPASLKTIGDSAFKQTNVANVTFAEGCTLETIGESAFDQSKLVSIDIPDTLKTLGTRAFYACAQLKTIDMPKGGLLERIEGNMFNGCTRLTDIVIPNGVTWMGYGVFYGCSALESAVLPNSLESMDTAVFQNCTSLKTVNLPVNDAFTVIPAYTFQKCESLTEITIPDNVMVISSDAYGSGPSYYYAAFSQCTNLKTVNISENSKLTAIQDATFLLCPSLEEIYIPAGVTYLGSQTFDGCTSLKKVTFADGVRLDAIADSLFNGCSSLTSVEIPMTVKTIGNSAFKDCSSMTTVEMISGIEVIGDSAFENCAVLEVLPIVDTVKEIGSNVFSGCGATIEVDTANVNYLFNNGMLTDAFQVKIVYISSEATGELVIPDSVTSLAAGAFRNSQYSKIVLPEGIHEVGDYMFANSKLLTEVVLPSTITKIGDFAFEGCEALEKITIGRNVTKIGANAFKDCTALSEVNFEQGGSSLMQIGDSAFENCVGLTTIDLPARLRSTFKVTVLTYYTEYVAVPAIGQSAFKGCTGLTSVTFNQTGAALIEKGNVLSIGHMAFEGCTDLATMQLPAYFGYPTTVDDSGSNRAGYALGSGAFRYCTSLTALPLPEKLDSEQEVAFGEFAFEGCTGLKVVNIPAYVNLDDYFSNSNTTNYAFMGCTGITEVTMPSNNWSGIGLFSGCTSLTTVTMLGYTGNTENKMIPTNSFEGCTSLTTVNLPDGIESLGMAAFKNCSGLTAFEVPASVTWFALEYYYGKYSGYGNPFPGCSNLELSFAEGNTSFKVVDGSIYSADGSILYAVAPTATSFIVPETVVKIAGSAFAYSANLTSVVLPSSLEDSGEWDNDAIGDSAFEGSAKLTVVDFSKIDTSKVFSIFPEGIFKDCTSLTTVILPEGGRFSVGEQAFKNCSSLEWIDFSCINDIYDEAFMNCSGLTFDEEHKLNLNIEYIYTDAFDGCGTIYVDGNYEDRPRHYNWTDYADWYDPTAWISWYGDSVVVWNDQTTNQAN